MYFSVVMLKSNLIMYPQNCIVFILFCLISIFIFQLTTFLYLFLSRSPIAASASLVSILDILTCPDGPGFKRYLKNTNVAVFITNQMTANPGEESTALEQRRWMSALFYFNYIIFILFEVTVCFVTACRIGVRTSGQSLA